MSLKNGLNLKKKGPEPQRRTILDDEDGEDDEQEVPLEELSSLGTSGRGPQLTGRPKLKKLQNGGQDSRQDLSALQSAKVQVKAAQEVDASIFDYDSFHDAKSSVTNAKREAARQEAVERKPKYINNLLDAAERRKQDQQVAKEKLLQREREAEGDEFADKEKFVTGAYKQQQEENRRLEAEEKKKAEEEDRRKRQMGGGMQGFYRTMMDEQERQHQQTMDAAAKAEKEGIKVEAEKGQKSDAELVAELKAQGINVHLNEEGQVTDKRELLSAGLNVAPSGRSSDKHAADHLRVSNRTPHAAFQNRNGGNQQAQRERQTRMMEEQLAAQAKRARDEEDEERAKLERAAKSTKTEKDVSDAKARYLARKAAKERGEG